MAPPGKPYSLSGAAGLSKREAEKVDPDYQVFLDHVRMDGDSYALYLPSKDGVAPPVVIRYEQRLPGSNVGAPVAGSEGGGQGGPSPSLENSYGAASPRAGVKRKAQHASPRASVKRKAPHASPRAEARTGAVPMEQDLPAPAPEAAFYDFHSDIDKDYRFFLRHVRVMNEGKAVFKMGNLTIPFGHEPSVDSSCAEEDGCLNKQAGVDTDLQTGNVIDLEVKEGVKEEEDDEDSQEEELDEEEVGPQLDLHIVNVMEFEMEEEVEEGAEKPLSAPLKGVTESQPLNREASSSKGHPVITLNASEPEGVIWPPHITERPNSDFKTKLMQILTKPFNQEEYDKYFEMATRRSPVVKERRTRHTVKYYDWKHETSKSYFENYPEC